MPLSKIAWFSCSALLLFHTFNGIMVIRIKAVKIRYWFPVLFLSVSIKTSSYLIHDKKDNTMLSILKKKGLPIELNMFKFTWIDHWFLYMHISNVLLSWDRYYLALVQVLLNWQFCSLSNRQKVFFSLVFKHKGKPPEAFPPSSKWNSISLVLKKKKKSLFTDGFPNIGFPSNFNTFIVQIH